MSVLFILVLFLSGALAQDSSRAGTVKVNKAGEDSIRLQVNKESPTVDSGQVFIIVAVMPQYPGGYPALLNYLQKNIKIPNNGGCFTGSVFAGFVIDEQGNVTDVQILRGINCDFDKESLARCACDAPMDARHPTWCTC